MVYQWKMQRYWHVPSIDFSNGLSAVDNFGGIPKPHQYIVKDIGYDTPNNAAIGAVESSLKLADQYRGADAGDGLMH